MPDAAPASERPASQAFLKLAEEHRRTGQTDEALKVLEAGLAKNPSYLAAQVARARCLLDLGRTAESVAALEPVLERDATQLVARKLLVEAHLRRGEAHRARRQLDLYAVFSSGDPEIEALRDRIQDLLLTDAAPLAPAAAMATSEVAAIAEIPEPPATDRIPEPELWPPEPLLPEAPSVAPEAPRPTAAPAVPVDGRDPFPELRAVDRRRHLQRLAAEGIFTLPESVVPEEQPVAEPGLPGETVAEEPGAEEPGTEQAAAWGTGTEELAEAEPVATVTLGDLYLRQGHYQEAEEIFLAVLRQDPANAQAQAGLAALSRAGTLVEPWSEEPEESEAQEGEAGAGETAVSRKVVVLKRYLASLRAGAERNVP